MLDIELILLVLFFDLFLSLFCASVFALKLTAFVTIVTEKRLFVGPDDFADFDEFLFERFDYAVFCDNHLI